MLNSPIFLFLYLLNLIYASYLQHLHRRFSHLSICLSPYLSVSHIHSPSIYFYPYPYVSLTLFISLLPFRPSGRPLRLNLHGHSIAVDRSTAKATDILIFGGKDALDNKDFEVKKKTNSSHFCKLNIITGVAVPVVTKNMPPENRLVSVI